MLALRVPADLPPKQLAVDIQPYSLKGAGKVLELGIEGRWGGMAGQRCKVGGPCKPAHLLQANPAACCCCRRCRCAAAHPSNLTLPSGSPLIATCNHSTGDVWLEGPLERGLRKHRTHPNCAALPPPTPHAVFNRSTGDVYLEGTLERGVVPEDCFWTHCGGEGEDGCAISLRKMNLEVLQK